MEQRLLDNARHLKFDLTEMTDEDLIVLAQILNEKHKSATKQSAEQNLTSSKNFVKPKHKIDKSKENNSADDNIMIPHENDLIWLLPLNFNTKTKANEHSDTIKISTTELPTQDLKRHRHQKRHFPLKPKSFRQPIMFVDESGILSDSSMNRNELTDQQGIMPVSTPQFVVPIVVTDSEKSEASFLDDQSKPNDRPRIGKFDDNNTNELYDLREKIEEIARMFKFRAFNYQKRKNSFLQ